MLKCILILNHAPVIKLRIFMRTWLNRWGCFLSCCSFNLRFWSLLHAAVSLPLAFFLQPQLQCCCTASPCLIPADTAMWLKAISHMCVLPGLFSGKKENLGSSLIWSSLPDAACIRRAPVPLSCLLLVQLGSSCAPERQEAQIQQNFCLPRASFWDSISRTPLLSG